MLTPQDYTVGIICPLEVEMSAVRYMLDREHDPPTLPKYARYIFGELSKHKVVIATLPIHAQGKVFTAMAASELKQRFKKHVKLPFVGIGGGVPTQGSDVRLGDVVIGTPGAQHCGVVQYDLGKGQIDGFKRKGYLAPPAREWLDAIPKMRSDHRLRKSNINDFVNVMQARMQSREGEVDSRQFMRPPQAMDLLFKPDYAHPQQNRTCRDDDQEYLVERARRKHPRQPVIHYGLIASGDCVVKSGTIRDAIAHDAGKAICFEMEAAGLMNDFSCLAIRGICDYADSHKNDDWHGYAAAVAAGMAKEILMYLPPAPVSESIQRAGSSSDRSVVFSGLFNADRGKIYNFGGDVTGGHLTFG